MKLGKQGGGGLPEKFKAQGLFGRLDFLPSSLVKADKATHPAQIDFFRADAVVFGANGLPSNLQQTGTVSLIIHDPNTPELDPKSDA